MQIWRLVDTGYAGGYWNMAVDEAILQEHIAGRVPPTLRFYAWKPATVTTGYFQDMEKEIDVEACQKAGFHFVRRLTGGRAVLHDVELTYSIVAREDNPVVSGSILESYLKISRGLLAGLAKLGIQAEMVTHVKKTKGSAACFDSPSWYEVVYQGRKLVGSAQTRKHGVILQHGSIPFILDGKKLFSVLKIKNEELRERLAQSFKRQACGLNEILGREISYAEAVEAFAQGFAEALGVTLEKQELTSREQELAQQLEWNKYRSREWNFRKK